MSFSPRNSFFFLLWRCEASVRAFEFLRPLRAFIKHRSGIVKLDNAEPLFSPYVKVNFSPPSLPSEVLRFLSGFPRIFALF